MFFMRVTGKIPKSQTHTKQNITNSFMYHAFVFFQAVDMYMDIAAFYRNTVMFDSRCSNTDEHRKPGVHNIYLPKQQMWVAL